MGRMKRVYPLLLLKISYLTLRQETLRPLGVGFPTRLRLHPPSTTTPDPRRLPRPSLRAQIHGPQPHRHRPLYQPADSLLATLRLLRQRCPIIKHPNECAIQRTLRATFRNPPLFSMSRSILSLGIPESRLCPLRKSRPQRSGNQLRNRSRINISPTINIFLSRLLLPSYTIILRRRRHPRLIKSQRGRHCRSVHWRRRRPLRLHRRHHLPPPPKAETRPRTF